MITKPPPQDPLRAAAEARVAAAAPEPAAGDVEKLLHDLRVHQIELEMQNETLRETQFALEVSRDRYLDLYEFAPVGYLTLSREGTIEQINLTGAALLGEERKRLLKRVFSSYVVAEERDQWRLLFGCGIAPGECRHQEYTLQRRDGSRFHALLDCRQALDGSGLRITLSDISERKRAEEELRIAAIAFQSQEGMIVTDAHGVILRVNPAFTRLTGYSAAEAIGQTPALLRSGRHDKAFYGHMWQSLRETGYWQGEVWNRRKNGKIYAEWLTISAVIAPDGAASHYVGAFSEIVLNKEAQAEIHRLAYYDPLTLLPNRRLLLDRLGQALAGSQRSGRYGALLFLDLDQFKNLNDSRGHAVGDLLLCQAAERLQGMVREGDTIARLGGDEFVMVLEGLSAEAEEVAVQVRRLGEKVCACLAQPYDLEGRECHLTASLGITLFFNHEVSVETLLKQADLALYQAKGAGRNCLRFFDPAMQMALDRRGLLESGLRQALQQGQLRLYYQTQVDGGGRVVAAEALVRWQHPERGLLLPGEFIDLAEETGLILPLGFWVMYTACAQLQAWSASAATRDLRLAVNVSPRQFRQADFVAEVQGILAVTCADPNRLEIELTENLVLDDIDDTLAKLRDLKALGIRISLDDFGTGNSSLSCLTRLPLDQLKIDRSFILNLPDSHRDAVIAQTIVTMAHSLGLDVIAEGVENEAQRAFLAEHRCYAYQGYLFARPLPLAEFEAILAV